MFQHTPCLDLRVQARGYGAVFLVGEIDGFLQALLGYAFAANDVADFYVGIAARVLFGAGSSEFYAATL